MRGLMITALVLGAIVLVPSGAHLLELPHKFAMDRDAYFVTQQLYAGWALFGIPIISAIFIDLLLWRSQRRAGDTRAWLALSSAALIALGLVVFFVWIFPANRETENWTIVTDDWAMLRLQWEYAHAVVAALTLAAFICVAMCCSTARRIGKPAP